MDALAKSETSAKVLDQIGMVLESINDPSIFPQLRDLALSDQPHRAATAIGLLGSFKDKKSASTLRLLAVNEKSAKVRAAALVALAQLADEEAATLAQKALVANKFRVRIAAVQVFGMIGRAPDAKLLEALVADEKAEVVVATVLALGDLVERTKVSRGLALIHSALKAKNKSVVMVAIEQTERVGSRDISVKHLQGVMARNKEDASRGLRKRAAIALFRMGDTGGLESYAKPLELAAKRNPKRSQNQWRLLSELYWEFRDYKACLRSTTKYANFDLNFLDLDKMRMRMARCQSRLGKFKRAYDLIEKAKGTTSWPELADDEDFAAMRKQSRYRKNFANPEPK
ncbi:MAG: HEAT repeat domain-containing protein, partial [Planctomycetota bacterium]